jgi:hypothetical protein
MEAVDFSDQPVFYIPSSEKGASIREDPASLRFLMNTKEGNVNLTNDLRDAVAFRIGYSVPEVSAVFVSRDNRALHVWSVVPEYSRDLYRRIYAKEKEIISEFEHIDFDFNVVASHDRDPKALVTDECVQLAYLRK